MTKEQVYETAIRSVLARHPAKPAMDGTHPCSCPTCQILRAALEAPDEPAEPFFECCNDACPWRGPKSETVHPKHDPDRLLCPECHEVVEQE